MNVTSFVGELRNDGVEFLEANALVACSFLVDVGAV